MGTYKPLCIDCALLYKKAGYFFLYLPPYLRAERNVITCYHCEKVKEHDRSVNLDMPRKAVRYSEMYRKPAY